MECDLCHKHFARKDSHKRHMLTHTRSMLKCKVCADVFSDATKLQSHMQAQHRKMVKCRQCGKSFSGSHALRSHMQNAHKGSASTVQAEVDAVPAAPPIPPPDDLPVTPPLVSLTDDSVFPSAAVKRQLMETYDDDLVEFILTHWRYVRTMTVVRDLFNTVRQVRLTVPKMELGAALRKLLMDVVLTQRSAFKFDMAFTTINRDKQSSEKVLRYAEKNSLLFGEKGPVLIGGMDDVPDVMELLHTDNVFNFVSMLRPDSHTYVAAVVGVSFYITPLDFPILS